MGEGPISIWERKSFSDAILTIHEVMFFGTILLCMSLATYYKRIDDVIMKKNYGAGLGLLVVCILCGDQIYYTVFLVWGNIIIIKCCDKRYVHHMSLAYTWIYLVYIYNNMNTSIYAIWIVQTISLRLVGLAFETYFATVRPGSRLSLPLSSGDTDKQEEPPAIDIITYAYFFEGLHRGPYYRWKVFHDHFKAPFGVLGDCRIITEHKLKKALVCCLAYLLLKFTYSPQVYFFDEFYQIYGAESRYLYSVPQLILYFLLNQSIMMLCTSVCTESGFGVYPAKCLPLPGYGPSAEPSLLQLASTKASIALQQEYNFSMLKSFENEKIFFGPCMRDTLSGWDLSTQYWFQTYIYKGAKGNKEVKTGLTFIAWWIWSDPTLQRLIMASTLCVYVLLEDEYLDLCGIRHETLKFPWYVGFSIMRLFCLLYLTPCLMLRDTPTVLRYYNSLYWVYHIILCLLVIGLFVSTKLNKNGTSYP